MKKFWLLLVVPAVLLLWWAAARRDSVASVHFAVAKRQTLESVVSTNGKLEPVDYAAARAEIAGVVQDVLIERGQEVRAGQPLVALDSVSERAAVDTAKAQLEAAKAELETVRQGGKLSLLTNYEGQLQAAQMALRDAQRKLDSAKRLYAKQAATRAEVIAAETALANAKQTVQAIENNRQSLVAPSDRDTSIAKFQDAKAGLALAQHKLDLSVIKAPMAGIAYQFDIKKGAYLEIGALVAMVGNIDQMRVRVYVDEPDLGRISQGLPVDITWQARPGQHWHGRVTQVPTEVIALQTRQVGVVTCTIDNPDHELLPGTNIDANIISRVVHDAVSVPKQALQSTATQAGVWKLINGNRITWQPVTAGVSTVTSVEIKSGLNAGDRVVLPSDATLKNGMQVDARPEQAT